MAILHNNTARLLVGLTVSGDAPRWSPGANDLDPDYWRSAKRNNTIRSWLHLGYIKVDLNENSANPDKPPTQAELSEFPTAALKGSLNDPTVPLSWHPVFKLAIETREAEEQAKKEKRLIGLKIEEALPLINGETDVTTLDAWADNDKRIKIKEAIDARLSELDPTEGD